MASIENIYAEYKSNYVDSIEYSTEFFSRHAVYLNNKTNFSTKEELSTFIELTWQQTNILYHQAHYNIIIKLLKQRLDIVEKEIFCFPNTNFKDDWYYGLLFFKAMALYYLNDYKNSNPIFKVLQEKDPQNDSYKKWYNYSLAGLRFAKMRIGYFISGGLLLGETILKSQIEEAWIRRSILWVSVIGMASLMIYEFYLKRKLRKLKI